MSYSDDLDDKIRLHHLAIIYTYRFNCCGNITGWGADVHPGGGDVMSYILDFQVWRPSPTVNNSTGTGCYSLVGNNRFTSVSLYSGLARVIPSPQHYIQFQPGDVLGFHVEGGGTDNHGVLVRRDNDREVVWHASIDSNEAALLREGCPYPWPAGNSELDITLIRAAPVISINTSNYILVDCIHSLNIEIDVLTSKVHTPVLRDSCQPFLNYNPLLL